MRLGVSEKLRWAFLGAFVAAVSGIVYASIPDGGTVFHGCYATKDGALRVVETSADCDVKKELPIAWNATGPAGPTGPQGLPGIPGLPGTNGATGAQGLQGPAGPTGAQGPAGATGLQGTQGTTGATGATGPAGALDTTAIVTQPLAVPPHVASPAVSATAICPSGMTAVSGGFFIVNLDPNAPPGALISWRPQLDRWQVFFYNPSNSITIDAQAIAYCAAS